jgi:purine-nucleoside phosphorylase
MNTNSCRVNLYCTRTKPNVRAVFQRRSAAPTHRGNSSGDSFFTRVTRASFRDSKELFGLREGDVTAQREFVTYKGELEGKKVCVTSTGIGCPSAAIVVEELANCGVMHFIRVGTTGAIQEDVELGDIILPEAVVRDDGTTKEYVGNENFAVANSEVVAALRNAHKQRIQK